MTFPVLEREPVAHHPLPRLGNELWDALLELTEVRPGEWTLVGGQTGTTRRRDEPKQPSTSGNENTSRSRHE